MMLFGNSIIISISAVTQWAIAIYSACGLSLLAVFTVMVALTWMFKLLGGVMK